MNRALLILVFFIGIYELTADNHKGYPYRTLVGTDSICADL
ncbi:MAG: hypothetical protein U9R01_01010 [candidate division WOR-3 bacterium]|nr:hypothetical protein [candidate division WOR-3 bacterium]